MKNLDTESAKTIKEMKEAFKRVGVSFSGIKPINNNK